MMGNMTGPMMGMMRKFSGINMGEYTENKYSLTVDNNEFGSSDTFNFKNSFSKDFILAVSQS